MESYMFLLDFVGILRETLKIFCKNKQVMASLTLLTLSLYSILYLSNVFTIQPLISDLLLKSTLIIGTSPQTPEFASLLIGMGHDVQMFVGVEWIFFFISTMSSLLLATATIMASGIIHGGKNLSIKELLGSTIRSLKRAFITWFYITLFGVGYVYFVLANLLPLALVLIVEHPIVTKALLIILVVLATVFYNYLAVIWTSGFVISVLEEKSGIQALGKATQIVKSNRLHGFLLNLLFTILNVVLFQGMKLMTIKKSSTFPVIIGLLVVNCICMVKMVWLMSYTVFYFKCKKTHGEEVELQGSNNIEYNQIPSVPLLNENIP